MATKNLTTNTTTGKVTVGTDSAPVVEAQDITNHAATSDKSPKAFDAPVELEVKLTKEMQAVFDAPVSSTEDPHVFPDNSRRKESGFEATITN